MRFIWDKNVVKPRTVQEYFYSKPQMAQERLNELRDYLKEAVPGASDELKWGKPALVNDGILFVYAAAKTHVSLHPTPSVISHLRDKLGSMASSENTIQFSLIEPIPKALISEIAKLRVYEKEDLGIKWK